MCGRTPAYTEDRDARGVLGWQATRPRFLLKGMRGWPPTPGVRACRYLMGNTLSSASISTLRMMAVLSTEDVRESACARVKEAAKDAKALGVLEIDGAGCARDWWRWVC